MKVDEFFEKVKRLDSAAIHNGHVDLIERLKGKTPEAMFHVLRDYCSVNLITASELSLLQNCLIDLSLEQANPAPYSRRNHMQTIHLVRVDPTAGGIKFINPNKITYLEASPGCRDRQTLIHFEGGGNISVKGKVQDVVDDLEKRMNE